jgi:hypothetical protein
MQFSGSIIDAAPAGYGKDKGCEFIVREIFGLDVLGPVWEYQGQTDRGAPRIIPPPDDVA